MSGLRSVFFPVAGSLSSTNHNAPFPPPPQRLVLHINATTSQYPPKITTAYMYLPCAHPTSSTKVLGQEEGEKKREKKNEVLQIEEWQSQDFSLPTEAKRSGTLISKSTVRTSGRRRDVGWIGRLDDPKYFDRIDQEGVVDLFGLFDHTLDEKKRGKYREPD